MPRTHWRWDWVQEHASCQIDIAGWSRIMVQVFVAVVALALVAVASAEEAPPPKVPAQVALVSPKGMFPLMQRLHDGRLAVVLRAGAGHLGLSGRLDMIFSRDEGKTWGDQVVVNDSPLDDRNPAFGVAKSGALVVGFYRTANYDDSGKYNPYLGKESSVWVTRSEDGGKTWLPAASIDCQEHGYGSPYGRMVTLPSGVMLLGIYGGALGSRGLVKGHRQSTYVYRSLDDGKTWKRLSQIGSEATQLNETALLRTSAGRLLAASRNRAYEMWTSFSDDDGATWSVPRKLAPAWVHPADLLEVPGGVLLLAGNRIGPFGVIGIVGSKSGDFDYAERFTIVDSLTSRDCGYPSAVTLNDGRVLALYYASADTEHKNWPRPHVAAATFSLPRK